MSFNGFDYVLKLDDTLVAGVNVVNSEHLREVLENTANEDAGWQSFHGKPGRRGLNLSIEGILETSNRTQLQAAYDANTNSDFTLETPYGQTVSAADGFAMANLSFGAPEKELVTFSCTLNSSGAVSEAATV